MAARMFRIDKKPQAVEQRDLLRDLLINRSTDKADAEGWAGISMTIAVTR